MTHLSIYKRVNLQFFVINFLPISATSFISGAKISSAIPNKVSQNQQSNSFSLNNASEKTDAKPAKSSWNRFIMINGNDFINRQGFSSSFILINKTIGNNYLWRCH